MKPPKVYTSKIRMHHVLEWLEKNTSAAKPATPIEVATNLVLPDGRLWINAMRDKASASGTLLNIVDIAGRSRRAHPLATNQRMKERRPDIYDLCMRVHRMRNENGAYVYWMEPKNA